MVGKWMRAMLVILSVVTVSWFVQADGFRLLRGGWWSSGGEVFRYAKNPWFVKNTKVVNYCVQFDEASMSTSKGIARQNIEVALEYWRQELYTSGNPGPGQAHLGDQVFVYHELCNSEEIDIVFKFGYGTLSSEEVEYLKDPRQYLGVAVLQEYDFVNMKGRGFIYISSDLGPYAYNSVEDTEHLIPEAWRHSKFLQYVLIHELGHVFGIPHTGVGVMSEVFLDQLLHRRFARFYLERPLEPFLRPVREFEVCRSSTGEFNYVFFGLDYNPHCLSFEAISERQWRTLARKEVSSEPEEIGTIQFWGATAREDSAQPAVIVHLPPEQTVFSAAERMVNNFLIGPVFEDRGVAAAFRRQGSARNYSLYIEMKPGSMTFVGEIGGRLVPVLTYVPPSLLQRIFPLGELKLPEDRSIAL